MGISESESWSVHEDEVTCKPVAYKKGAVKPAASSIPENSGNLKAEIRKWHIFFTSLRQSCLTRSRTCGRNGGPQRERGYLENVL